MRVASSLDALKRIWPGPQPYSETQAEDFFGRNREIGAALDRIVGQRLTVLLAPSATGKTSLLRAGIVPELRFARLEALETKNSAYGWPFPMLLNQWLGRVGPDRATNFGTLVLVEAQRYLSECLSWYEAEAQTVVGEPGYVNVLQGEMGRIKRAARGLNQLGQEVERRDEQGSREHVTDPQGEPIKDQRITDLLLEIERVLSAEFESVVLILDQFEEILSDSVLGRQAILAVDGTFRLCPDTIRQMISMRHDSAHLLEPLEAGGTLDQKRIMMVYPLTPERVTEIVKEVSKQSAVEWEPEALDRLIDAFTDSPEAGKGRRDVNLLGLQVVLRTLFEALAKGGTTRIDIEQIYLLCQDIDRDSASAKGDQAIDLKTWLARHDEEVDGKMTSVRAKLAAEAPRRWIEQSLAGVPSVDGPPPLPTGIHEGEYEAALLGTMVSRISEWLVTPAGFKRPMTRGELQDIAYKNDLKRLRDGDLAGRAMREGLKVSDPVQKERLEKILDDTFRVALHRLVVLGHVLKGRGSDSDASYELVHDQFGKPLQAWARSFRRTPHANLGSLYATDDVRFEWGRDEEEEEEEPRTNEMRQKRSRDDERTPRTKLALSIYEEDGRRMLEWVKWRGCTIHGVDFSGVTISGCDFSRSEFVDCYFGRSTTFINKCRLTSALFRGCEFEGTRFENTTLDDSAWRERTSLEGVTFDACSLDGVTVGTKSEGTHDAELALLQLGNLSFNNCGLQGAEFVGLDFATNSLSIEGGAARGAVFTRVSFEVGGTKGGATFNDVDLRGALFLGCCLPRARFTGENRVRAEGKPASLTPCATVVIKGAPGLPSLLANARFANLDMRNLEISESVLRGKIEFNGCQLAGGTIQANADANVATGRMCDHLRLSFQNGCDLAALELIGLDFSDGALEVLDSQAASLRLQGVNLPRREGGKPRALFSGCDMPGVLFEDSAVHGLKVEGSRKRRRAHAPALIVRGGDLGHSFGESSFRDADLENFTFDGVDIDGELSFSNCNLSGGTIAGVDDKATRSGRRALLVRADLAFTHKCDLRAVEFRTVDFDGGRLLVRDSLCDGMILIDVTARSDGARKAIELWHTSIEGVVLGGCRISGLVATGRRTENSLTRGWGITVRSEGDSPMILGDAVFCDLDLDGLVVDGLTVDGPVTFTRCTLLRSRFAEIKRRGREGSINVHESDLMFAQVDGQLLESAETKTPILDMDQDQLRGARTGAKALPHLKYRPS